MELAFRYFKRFSIEMSPKLFEKENPIQRKYNKGFYQNRVISMFRIENRFLYLEICVCLPGIFFSVLGCFIILYNF